MFCYWNVWVPYMFWILTPNWIYSLQIFSPIHRLPFHSVGYFRDSLFMMLTFLLTVGVPYCALMLRMTGREMMWELQASSAVLARSWGWGACKTNEQFCKFIVSTKKTLHYVSRSRATLRLSDVSNEEIKILRRQLWLDISIIRETFPQLKKKKPDYMQIENGHHVPDRIN